MPGRKQLLVKTTEISKHVFLLCALLCMIPFAFSETVSPLHVYGIASWYSESDPSINLRTANGEIFNDRQLTCATWHFPFGAYLRVENLANGKSVVCRVNDRGPSRRLKGRVIDLTKTAFRHIADPRLGLADVAITPVKKSRYIK